MPGAQLAPTALCAMVVSTQVVTADEAEHRHSLRDGVNGLYRARPGETGFCVTVTRESSSASLAPATRAPGPHALAVRSVSHVLRHVTSIASRAPRLVTIGRTPLFIEAGRCGYIHDSEKRKINIFRLMA